MGVAAALLQFGQPAPGLLQGGPRKAGQRGHLQAETAVGRTVLDRVHEHQALAAVAVVVLDRIQMHVGDAMVAGLAGQRGQFEIVGGEQGPAAVGRGQVAGDRVGQGQAVVGGGAATDLVHQHQRLRGGVVEDVAGLGHLDHEGGLAAGQVVAGADAGEDAVDRADHRARGRHEAADVGQQHDQRVLAHVGALAAHVRAGDHQHPARVLARFGLQHQVVGLERLGAHRLHHRVAAAFDPQAGIVHQFRLRPVQRLGAFGEGGQHVQFAQCGGAALEWFQGLVERIEQCLVQQLLACQRPFACRQHLVLETLQFLGDVALGTGQGLAPGVVHRRLVGLALADLDVVAVHPVVADLERGDAAAGALACLQFDQELVGVGGQAAQFVQFGIVAFGDDAAIDQLQRWLGGDRAGEPLRGFVVAAHLGGQRLQARRVQRRQLLAQRRQHRQAVAQGGQVARARRAQRHPGEDAFQVAQAAEAFAQVGIGALFDQRGHRLVALAQHLALAQRPVQPAPQQAPAHRGDGGIEHAQQGVAAVAVDPRVQLQVAAGGRVHRDRIAGGFHRDRGQVRQLLLLGLLDIAEQGAGGGDRQRQVLDAETGQVVHAEKAQQLAPAAVGIEQPRRAPAHCTGTHRRHAFLVGDQQLGRLQPRQFGLQLVLGFDLVDQEAAAGQVGPGQPVPALAARHRHQQGVAALVQQRLVGHRAGGDDAHHLAFHQALGQRRVADLLADGHRFAQSHQPRQVALVGMHRHPGHRDRRPARTAALGQGDVQQPRRLARIVVEQLVEVAHAEQQQQVRVFGLGGEELLHQRGVFGLLACTHKLLKIRQK